MIELVGNNGAQVISTYSSRSLGRFSCLVFASIALVGFLGSDCHATPQVDDDPKVALVNALIRHQQQLLGKELEMGGRNLNMAQIAAMREAGITTHDDEMVYYLRISPAGDIWHQESIRWQTFRGEKRKLIGASYSNRFFSVAASSGMTGDQHSPIQVTGDVVVSTRKNALSGVSPLNLFLGWFDYANGSLADFCQDVNSQVTVESTAFDRGLRALKFVVVRDQAELQVWIESDVPEPRLLQVEFWARPGLKYDVGYGPQVISTESNVDSHVCRCGPIRYDGLGLPTFYGIDYTILKSSKEVFKTSESETTIRAIRQLAKSLNPHQVEFELIDLPNPVVVRVDQGGEPGFRYELQNGRLVKLADGNAIAAAGDARFRQPESPFWYYTIWIGALVIVMCLALWLKRRSQAK